MIPSAISPRPLAGIKVLELGQLIAGPFAGKIFAEFGAERIYLQVMDLSDLAHVELVAAEILPHV